jgi:DMSO reductase anchor subunit
LPSDTRPVGIERVQPDHAHLPLVVMTVLTQLSVGAFVAIWISGLVGDASPLAPAALAALATCAAALTLAPLHLGRPIHAYRAMKMWRRSWLSREVVLFGGFMHVAAAYAGMLWFDIAGTRLVGAVTASVGLAAAVATSYIYLVPSRPSWNTRLTVVQFLLSAAVLGSLTVALSGAGPVMLWRGVAAASAASLCGLSFWMREAFRRSRLVELRGTAHLMTRPFGRLFLARVLLLAGAGVVLPLVTSNTPVLAAALVVSVAAELIGRYLFFVTAVPRHMTAAYLEFGSEAA